MTRRLHPIPVAPGQTTLDDVLRAYPLAPRWVTPTGRVLVLIPGGGGTVAPAALRKVAA